MKKRTFVALLLATTVGGLAFRLPALSNRVVHGDEAVHMYKCNELWQTGHYAYDPHEYHGPTPYYLTLPALWMRGAADWRDTTAGTFRIVPVIAGLALVLAMGLLADGIGRRSAIVAAILAAVSPPLVYYSRYYIQETLLTTFAMLAIVCGWRYVVSRRRAWAIGTGVGLGLMHATKETAIIMYGALAAAGVGVALWQRGAPIKLPATAQRGTPLRIAIPIALICALLVSTFLFTSFFSNATGPLDALQAYTTYANRAVAGDHLHPWHMYLRLLCWTDHPGTPAFTSGLTLLLATVGIIAVCTNRLPPGATPALARFVVLYAAILLTIYSAIPYKTPWCALGPLHGLILLAGIGAATLLHAAGRPTVRAAILVVIAAGTVHMAWQAHAATTWLAGDPRNPWAYAHPVSGIHRMVQYLDRLNAVVDRPLVIKVLLQNEWPLPWYLRQYDRVGYWNTIPDDPDADIVLVSQRWADDFSAVSQNTYSSSTYGLRRDETMIMYVAADVRAAFEDRFAEPMTQP